LSAVADRSSGAQTASASVPEGAVPVAGSRTRWPDLYVVGAANAGTTSLWWYLDQHPDVFMSAVKEPHFFARIRPSARLARFSSVVREESAYHALFAGVGGARVMGEASTSSLWAPEAAGRIHEVAPGARIVILLRDPVERAWAHHRADAAEGFERRGFLRSVRDEMARPGTWGVDSVYVTAGFYAEAVARYLGLFGRDQVQVLFFETFIVDPRGSMRDLFAWLDVEPAVADTLKLEPGPVHKRPRQGVSRRIREAFERRLRVRQLGSATDEPVMDGTVRGLLRNLYAPDVERLAELLGIVPPWGGPDPPGR
jgi:hypothetical protein